MARTVVNVNINVGSVEELKALLRELKTDEYEPVGGPLGKAIDLAQDYIEQFIPFTYEDVALPMEKRNYRGSFRKWATENNIDFKRIKGPGKSGSQGALFYPFYIDKSGQKILAERTEEG